MNKKTILLLLTCLLVTTTTLAQSLEMGAVGGPSGNGPTTAPQTVTLYNNGTTPYVPTTTVTYTLSNQQFGPGTVQGLPAESGISFGATTSIPLYPLMNSISSATSAMFNACNFCPAGTSISTTTNNAISLFLNSNALIDAAGNNLVPVNSKVYFGNLTLTFNRPVNNPVIHLVGAGASTTISSLWYYDTGTALEFDVLTPGVTISKLSGNTFLNVSGNSVTNTATALGFNSVGASLHGVIRNAASGSLLITGTNITTLVLKLYIRGDGGVVVDGLGTPQTPEPGFQPKWGYLPSVSFSVPGDQFLIGVSTPISPTVNLVKKVTPTGVQSPGTDLTYSIDFTNSGDDLATNTIITDPLPINTDYKLGSAISNSGTTSITFIIEFSTDNGATWAYVPVSGGGGAAAGYDLNVKMVRWRTANPLPFTAPNNTGSVSFTTKIR